MSAMCARCAHGQTWLVYKVIFGEDMIFGGFKRYFLCQFCQERLCEFGGFGCCLLLLWSAGTFNYGGINDESFALAIIDL